MPDCLAGSHKKVIQLYHKVPPASECERLAFLKQAKLAVESKPQNVGTDLTIQNAFSSIRSRQASTQKPTVIVPIHKLQVGKTLHYPRFCTNYWLISGNTLAHQTEE